MHYVLEGCVPYVVKELLKYLDQNNIVTLEELNDRIENFPYVLLDAQNKPTQIPGTTFSSSDHTLKQKVIPCVDMHRLLPCVHVQSGKVIGPSFCCCCCPQSITNLKI